MARTRRHTRMRDVLTIRRPDTTAQNQFGGVTQGSYSTVATIRCTATQYSGDSDYRDYNQDTEEQEWELLIRKKSLPALTGNELFVLETPSVTMKLNSKIEQDERTLRLRCSTITTF